MDAQDAGEQEKGSNQANSSTDPPPGSSESAGPGQSEQQPEVVVQVQHRVLPPRSRFWKCLFCFRRNRSLFVRKICYAVALLFLLYGILTFGFSIYLFSLKTHNNTVEYLFFVSPISAFGGADKEGEVNGADCIGWLVMPVLLDILPAILLGVGTFYLKQLPCIVSSCLFFISSIHDIGNFFVMLLALLMEGMLECQDCNAEDFTGLAFCMIVRLILAGLKQFAGNLACAFREQVKNKEYELPPAIPVLQPAPPAVPP